MRFVAVAALVSTVLMGSIATAEIPPVVGGGPGQGGSPGTGQTNPGQPDSPNGRPGNAGHPDQAVGNQPPFGWFTDNMFWEMNSMANAASNLASWASTYNRPQLAYYANWLRYVSNEYLYDTYYQQNGSWYPNYYPQWAYYPTRGDFIYFYYYWARPLYFQILREGYFYLQQGGPGYQQYMQAIAQLKYAYHKLTRCTYGKNGDDPQAADDDEAESFEDQAGANG